MDERISAAAAGMNPARALVALLWEMPDVTVAILRPDGRGVVEVNDAVEDLTGIPRAEVIGRTNLKGLWLEADEWPELLETIRTAGAVAGYPFSIRHRSGEVRYGHLWARRCSVDDEPAIVLLAREATESMRSERLLATEHAVAELLSRAAGPDDAVTRLLATLGERLGWDAALWWATGEGGQLRAAELWVSALFEPAPGLRDVLGTAVASGEGLPGRVLECGAPLWLGDIASETGAREAGASDAGGSWAALPARAGLRAAMAFPVCAAGHTYGVVQLMTRDPAPIDEALLETAEVLGRNAGLFLRAIR